MVRVRLFASLREAAGASEVAADGRTVGDVVDAVCGSYDARFAQIAAVSSFVVNGERAGLDTVLADGDEVAILPPVSGGGIGPLTTADLRVRRRDARLGY